MTTDNLAPVYLDNKPVSLQDPKPKVSAILSAGGKTGATDVKWLQFQPGTQGKSMRPEEVLDRTSEPSKPIYLTSAVKGPATATTGQVAKTAGGQAAAGAGTVKKFEEDPRHIGTPGREPSSGASRSAAPVGADDQEDADEDDSEEGSSENYDGGSKSKDMKASGSTKASDDSDADEEGDEDDAGDADENQDKKSRQ